MKPYLIQHLLDECCSRTPDKICIMDSSGSLSYEEVVCRSRKIAGVLVSLDVREGEHIGLFMDKSIEQVLSVLGILYAGCVLVVINPILRKEQISHIVQDCRVQTVIASQSKIDGHLETLKSSGVRKALIFQGSGNHGFDQEVSIHDRMENLPSMDAETFRITDDTSHIIYTSGSTGMPKGIVVSHRNSIDGAKIVSEYTGLTQDDKIISALPFNFDYGFNQMLNSLYVGATLYLHQFFMPNDLLNVLENEQITVFAGMAPIWIKIFNPRLTDLSSLRDFSRIRIITNTGGKVPVPFVQQLRKLFSSARIFLMYGLTEAFRSTFLDPSEIDRRPDSIGKAIPNVQILVLNQEGKECSAGEEGELVHRGALITKGYWNNPEKTAEVFRPNPMLGEENRHLETVVFSGDVVRKDEEGFIYYVGRRDNMIKTKGYRVSPTEVEELMMGIDGVNECIAAGFEKDDDILVRVFIVLKQSSISTDDILNHCKRQFPFYLVPDEIIILDHFPLTASGKTDRTRVIQEYGSHAKP